MEAVDMVPLIEQLDDNIDDLEVALSPLCKEALSESASKLPLLDKVQLYVLITYAIESIVFSFLRLNGVNAKEHPIFRELTRVKQYFDKINSAESGDSKREAALDKRAAERFIKHALAGNDKYDLKRAQQQAAERARAHVKIEQLSNKRKRKDGEGSTPNPNSQLIGAVSSQSSSSPVIASAAVDQKADRVTSAPEAFENNGLANTGSEQEQNEKPMRPPAAQESRTARKRRKREMGTLNSLNADTIGPEETVIPVKTLQVPPTGSASFQTFNPGAVGNIQSEMLKRKPTRQRKKEAKRAAQRAAKESENT
ncbi:exosome complex protein [Physcia stellaris]|nr:exosome complex protein [Physcia stellaris]